MTFTFFLLLLVRHSVTQQPSPSPSPSSSSSALVLYQQNFDGIANGSTTLGDGSTLGGWYRDDLARHEFKPTVFKDASLSALQLMADQQVTTSSFFLPLNATRCAANGWQATFRVRLANVERDNYGDGFTFGWGMLPVANANANLGGIETGFNVSSVLSFNTVITGVHGPVNDKGLWIAANGAGFNAALGKNPGPADNMPLVPNGLSSVWTNYTVRWSPSSGATFLTSGGLLANANVTNATVPSGFGGNGTAASFVFGFAVRTGGARMQVLIDDLLIVQQSDANCLTAPTFDAASAQLCCQQFTTTTTTTAATVLTLPGTDMPTPSPAPTSTTSQTASSSTTSMDSTTTTATLLTTTTTTTTEPVVTTLSTISAATNSTSSSTTKIGSSAVDIDSNKPPIVIIILAVVVVAVFGGAN